MFLKIIPPGTVCDSYLLLKTYYTFHIEVLTSYINEIFMKLKMVR